MRNLTALPGCVGLIVLASVSSVNAQTAKSAADYWPMKPGNTWTLLLNIGHDQTMKQVMTVTNVVKTVSGTVATINYQSNGRTVQTEKYRITPTQIVRLEAGLGGMYQPNPPFPIIKFPMTAGKAWNYSGTMTAGGQSASMSAHVTVSGPDTIKTPTGSFQAMRVHTAIVVIAQGQRIQLPNDYWFAPGVGLVRQRLTLNGTLFDGSIQSYKVTK